MPVLKCSNGKWRIGTGECMYKSKESADRAYAGYLAAKHSEQVGDIDRKQFAQKILDLVEALLEQDEWPREYKYRKNGAEEWVTKTVHAADELEALKRELDTKYGTDGWELTTA